MSRVESPPRGLWSSAAAQSLSSAGIFWRRWRAPEPRDAQLDPLLVLRLAGVALVVSILVAWLGDRAIATAARQLSDGAIALARIFSAFGASGYIFAISGIVTIACAALWRSGGGARIDAALASLGQRAFFVLCCNAAAGIAAQILKHVLARARPRLMDQLGPFHFDLFALDAVYASFPSGHATTAFATATALSLLAPRWRWPLFLFAAAIGVARVALGAHYPSDVIAGAFVGVISSYMVAAAFLSRRMLFAVRDGEARLRGRGLAGALRRLALSRRNRPA